MTVCPTCGRDGAPAEVAGEALPVDLGFLDPESLSPEEFPAELGDVMLALVAESTRRRLWGVIWIAIDAEGVPGLSGVCKGPDGNQEISAEQVYAILREFVTGESEVEG